MKALEVEQRVLDYLAHVDAGGQTLAEKICQHFIELGFPITSTIYFSVQLLGCGGGGCAFRVGEGIVMKISTDVETEIRTLALLSDAGLIGHPAYPVLTPMQNIYCKGVDLPRYSHPLNMCAYLLREVVPLDSIEEGLLDSGQWKYFEKGVTALKEAGDKIREGVERDPNKIAVGLQTIYRLGGDPMFEKAADFVFQAALRNLAIALDFGVENVGFLLSDTGEPMIEEGLVVYDLLGVEVTPLPGIDLYADYVLDENLGVGE